MVEITTPRLRLRRPRADDLHDLHAVLREPAAMQFWSTLPHTDLTETRQFLDDMIGTGTAGDDFVVLHEGRVIGKAGCWRLPEIGFIFHPDYWGRGLAFEALSAVIAHVFATHDIPAIVADVDPRNAGSLAILGKLGFRETGRASRTWHVGGAWCDSIYLALPRPAAVAPGPWHR